MKFIAALILVLSAMQGITAPSSKWVQKDDPNLPMVLLIGDGISIGYTTYVRQELNGKANLHRTREDSGSSTNVLASLERWLGTNKWDVIYFNCGLSDLKLVDETNHVATVEEYEQNLEQIAQQLNKTGAKLIWASSTPVPAVKMKIPRKSQDVPIYNATAKKVMDKHKIPICDLYSFILPNVATLQMPNNIYFNVEGNEALGKEAARLILQLLPPLKSAQGGPAK